MMCFRPSSYTAVMAQYVILAGYQVTAVDISELAPTPCNIWMPQNARLSANHENPEKQKLLCWLNDNRRRPLSLMVQCRIVVRRQLSIAGGYRDIRPAIYTLPLPRPMKQYLKFEGRLAHDDVSRDGEDEETDYSSCSDDSDGDCDDIDDHDDVEGNFYWSSPYYKFRDERDIDAYCCKDCNGENCWY